MIDAIIDFLRGDSVLQGLVGNRIFDANDVVEISKTGTPEAFDENNELLPCVLVKNIASSRLIMYEEGMSDVIQFFIYQRWGYRTIISVRQRIKFLINDKRIKPQNDKGACFRVLFDDDTRQVEDVALSAALEISNYRALWISYPEGLPGGVK